MTNLANAAKYEAAAHHLPTVERLLKYSVTVQSGCREWQRATDRGGYGITSSRRVVMSAHRLSYWIFNGPIEGELVVDHLCFNHKCIEPSHLVTLSSLDNARRQKSSEKTHCVNGHVRTEQNLSSWVSPTGKVIRQCKMCYRDRMRRTRQRLREEREAAANLSA